MPAIKARLDPHQTVEAAASDAGTSRVVELRAPVRAAGAHLTATMRAATWRKDDLAPAGLSQTRRNRCGAASGELVPITAKVRISPDP
jgi:hypothetical protein